MQSVLSLQSINAVNATGARNAIKAGNPRRAFRPRGGAARVSSSRALPSHVSSSRRFVLEAFRPRG
eukprot:11197361-Lingulodinium_polyedra.AAC.1